ncbi:MAG TPA: hypothetical protein VH157_12405 [Bryobacteraceae bacterium]|nr:hypothetical protein [Bryobacteraceae bacterium]
MSNPPASSLNQMPGGHQADLFVLDAHEVAFKSSRHAIDQDIGNLVTLERLEQVAADVRLTAARMIPSKLRSSSISISRSSASGLSSEFDMTIW